MVTNERITPEILNQRRRAVRGPLPPNCRLPADQHFPRDGVRLLQRLPAADAGPLPVMLSIAPCIKRLNRVDSNALGGTSVGVDAF